MELKKLSLSFNHSMRKRTTTKKEGKAFSCHKDFNYTGGLIVHVISASSEG